MKREEAPDLPPDVRPAGIDEIAAALLYEGYLLYPSRVAALKNRCRWVFGVLFPRDYSRADGGPFCDRPPGGMAGRLVSRPANEQKNLSISPRRRQRPQ
jgi:hypothetical protein